MLNFGRRDRIAEGKHVDKGALKPALYDPPGAAGRGGVPNPVARPSSTPTAPAHPTPPPAPSDLLPAIVDVPTLAPMPGAPAPARSTLFVGVNIQLKGVEISECDALVIEGHVEATVHSKAMQIAKPGTLKGIVFVDVAEIHGEFAGELTALTRLVVHGTGRVSGTIRYGRLIVAEGGELCGDVKRIDEATERVAPTRSAGTPLGPGAPGGLPSH